MIKFTVCCVTYNRPVLLGELIQSFEMQTYPAAYRELVILDDAGQYGHVRGNRWQIISFPRRIASLGEKRNICALMASPETTHFAIADDDDLYLPNWLELHAKNFEMGARWSSADKAYLSENNQIKKLWKASEAGHVLHPASAYPKELFRNMGGYPPTSGCEDSIFFQRIREHGICGKDPLRTGHEPYLIYRRFSNLQHMTCVPLDVYQTKYQAILPHIPLEVGWQRDYWNDINEYKKQGGET